MIYAVYIRELGRYFLNNYAHDCSKFYRIWSEFVFQWQVYWLMIMNYINVWWSCTLDILWKWVVNTDTTGCAISRSGMSDRFRDMFRHLLSFMTWNHAYDKLVCEYHYAGALGKITKSDRCFAVTGMSKWCMERRLVEALLSKQQQNKNTII